MNPIEGDNLPRIDQEIHQPEQRTGSPKPGEPAFLVVGLLRRPHGVHGEILMDVMTDFPERLVAGVTVYVGENYHPVRIHSMRHHGDFLLFLFDGYSNPEEVAELRNLLVFVRADDRPPLPEGEYYQHQLLGLRVIGDDGQMLGTLTQILETGANDVYIVRPETGPEILLPAIESVVKQIDLQQGEIRVHVLPGLL
jgi:16S rRNA processing protein RimM